jgi:hypothetical protein
MIRVVLRIAVAVVVLGVVASRVDLSQVGKALAGTSPMAIVLATVAAFASNLVISLRLQVLLAAQGVPARVGQTFAINLSAFFYNLFLPVGGVGVAALRLQRLSQAATGRLTAALTAIVCDRLTAIAALGLVGLVCWMADPHAKPAGGILVLLAGASTLACFVAPRAVPRQMRQRARELQASGHGTWWSAALARLAQALGSVARLSTRAIAAIIGISMLAQLPGILVFVALGDGLGLSVPLLSMGWIRSVVVVLSLLPISIGGVGVREGALVVTLHVFGIPAHDALALSILIFATTILAPGLVGGLVEAAQWLRPRREVAA